MNPKQVIVNLYNILLATNSMSSRHQEADDTTWAGDIHCRVEEALACALNTTFPDVGYDLNQTIRSVFGETLDVAWLNQEAHRIRLDRYNEKVSMAVAVAMDALTAVRTEVKAFPGPDGSIDPRAEYLRMVYNLLSTLQYASEEVDLSGRREEAQKILDLCNRDLSNLNVKANDVW